MQKCKLPFELIFLKLRKVYVSNTNSKSPNILAFKILIQVVTTHPMPCYNSSNALSQLTPLVVVLTWFQYFVNILAISNTIAFIFYQIVPNEIDM